MIDIFADKKTLVFIDQSVEFLSLRTDEDFIVLEDFIIISDGDQIHYQTKTMMSASGTTDMWQTDKLKTLKGLDKLNLLIELSYQKPDYKSYKYLSKSYVNPKDVCGVRLMTYDIVDIYSNNDWFKVGELSKLEKIDNLIVRPIKTLQRDTDNNYNLTQLIKEFNRGNKLDDLGI
jgi:hypothetical protein